VTELIVGLAACGLIVLGFWLVSRITGARVGYLDRWSFEPGETVLWRDDRADFGFLSVTDPDSGKPSFRLHRWPVLGTNRRILVACRTVTGRAMVTEVIYPGAAPGGDSRRFDGGLFRRGHRTLVVHPEATKHPDKGWVTLHPVAGMASTTLFRELRIYTDDVAGFRMPGEPPEPLEPHAP
jgi:hypothetical protein